MGVYLGKGELLASGGGAWGREKTDGQREYG